MCNLSKYEFDLFRKISLKAAGVFNINQIRMNVVKRQIFQPILKSKEYREIFSVIR